MCASRQRPATLPYLLGKEALLGQVSLHRKLGKRAAHHVLHAQLLHAQKVEDHQVCQAEAALKLGWLAQHDAREGRGLHDPGHRLAVDAHVF